MQPEQQGSTGQAVKTIDGADMPLQQAHRLTKDERQLAQAATAQPLSPVTRTDSKAACSTLFLCRLLPAALGLVCQRLAFLAKLQGRLRCNYG